MKNHVARIIPALAIIIVSSAVYVNGQTAHRITADVPFDFSVGKEKLAAGTYEFEVTNRHAYPGALVIRTTTPGAIRSFIIPALVDDSPKRLEPSLLFNRYGSTYFFAKMNAEDGAIALKVWKGHDEKRLAKESREVVPVRIQPTVTARR
jgi:hypothetical protein